MVNRVIAPGLDNGHDKSRNAIATPHGGADMRVNWPYVLLLCAVITALSILVLLAVSAAYGWSDPKTVIVTCLGFLSNAVFYLAQYLEVRGGTDPGAASSATSRQSGEKKTSVYLVNYCVILFGFLLLQAFTALEFNEVEWLRSKSLILISADDATRLDAGMIGTAQNAFLLPYYAIMGFLAGRSRVYTSFASFIFPVLAAEATSWLLNSITSQSNVLRFPQLASLFVYHGTAHSALADWQIIMSQTVAFGILTAISLIIAMMMWLSAKLGRGTSLLIKLGTFRTTA